MWFELQDVSERKIRFASNLSVKDLIERIEDTATEMEFRVEKKNGKVSTITYVFIEVASVSNKLANKLNFSLAKLKVNIISIFQLKVIRENKVHKTLGCLSVVVEVKYV